jgi:hypothetical protein
VWPLSGFVDSWSGPLGEYGSGLATSPLADWRRAIGVRKVFECVEKNEMIHQKKRNERGPGPDLVG